MDEIQEKVKELKKKGVEVFSFSRLGTFLNCQYEYYKTYIKHEKGIENCYTLLGSCIHKNIEDIYNGKSDIEKFKNNYLNILLELEMLGVNFPSEKIGDSWKADVNHFLTNFNKIDKKMLLEKPILFEIANGIWLRGFIDSVMPSDKGKPFVNIFDWKTSSKFTGKKLNEAGRQLLMYKLGLEDNTQLKVDKVMWFMIKYIYVCNMQKNGKVKKKMCNRGKWVKEMKSALEKELYKLGIDEFEVELLLDKAIKDNNLTCLPKSIQNLYWLEDAIVEYDITDENIEELKQYIINTIALINSKDKDEEEDWKPVEITKYNSFYCSVLCGHRKTCPHYKHFLKENADSFNKSEKKDEFDIFG